MNEAPSGVTRKQLLIGLAFAAVLSYRAFSFWLPTIPGAIAYIGILRQEPVRAAPDAASA